VCENLSGLRKALLVMHSPVDELVSIDQAALINTHAKHPKSFVSLDDADHLLTRDKDSRYAARVLATWASRYVNRETPESEPARHVPGATVVEGQNADGFLVSVNASGHQFIGDEPADQGGTNRGRIDRFTREISLHENLDEVQRALLLKIADRCPVHRTLENEITIESKLV